jgi:glutaminyl-peptide cyclotransferase
MITTLPARLRTLTLLFVLAVLAPQAGQAVAPPSPGFSGDRAFTQLKTLCDMGPRVPGSPAARKAGDWLLARLRACGDEVWEQPFTHVVSKKHPMAKGNPQWTSKGLGMRNIVCRFKPKATRRLLLAAHWDSRPFADMDPDKTKRSQAVLGANDAASGVAILLELARCLKAKAPGMGVDIVLFDGEDWGQQGHLEDYFLGSKAYARAMTRPLPEAGILLDMVGDRNLRLPMEPFSLQAAPDLMERLWSTAERLGYGHIFIREMGPAVQDDHLPIIQRGVPMVDLIDFDYPQWHTVRDTPAACSPASLDVVGKVVEALIRQGL